MLENVSSQNSHKAVPVASTAVKRGVRGVSKIRSRSFSGDSSGRKTPPSPPAPRALSLTPSQQSSHLKIPSANQFSQLTHSSSLSSLENPSDLDEDGLGSSASSQSGSPSGMAGSSPAFFPRRLMTKSPSSEREVEIGGLVVGEEIVTGLKNLALQNLAVRQEKQLMQDSPAPPGFNLTITIDAPATDSPASSLEAVASPNLLPVVPSQPEVVVGGLSPQQAPPFFLNGYPISQLTPISQLSPAGHISPVGHISPIPWAPGMPIYSVPSAAAPAVFFPPQQPLTVKIPVMESSDGQAIKPQVMPAATPEPSPMAVPAFPDLAYLHQVPIPVTPPPPMTPVLVPPPHLTGGFHIPQYNSYGAMSPVSPAMEQLPFPIDASGLQSSPMLVPMPVSMGYNYYSAAVHMQAAQQAQMLHHAHAGMMSHSPHPAYAPQMGSSDPSQPQMSPRSKGKGRKKPSKKPKASICLFVFHIPPEATEEELVALFSQYGKVASARIMFHGEGSERRMAALSRAESRAVDKAAEPAASGELPFESRGFGFVNMYNMEDAQRAITKLNGHHFHNKYLKVSFKKAKGEGHDMPMPPSSRALGHGKAKGGARYSSQ